MKGKKAVEGKPIKEGEGVMTRTLTVSRFYSPSRSAYLTALPLIRFRGQWLVEAGFYPGLRIKVTVTTGKLVIEPAVEDEQQESRSRRDEKA